MHRILVVDLEREWRGGQNQALLLLQGLSARGRKAELLSVQGAELAARAKTAGIPVHAVRNRFGRIAAAFLLHRFMNTERFNVVHANEPHALTAAWLARVHSRACLVAGRRVAYPIGSSAIARARYRAARCIIAVSAFVARSLRESGIADCAIRVVHDGVILPPLNTVDSRRVARARWKAAEREPLVGCVGYLLPEKGQEFLLRAFPLIRARFETCRLLLVGDGPERANLERLANKLGVQDAVNFAGHVRDLDSVYNALDVFVFPSLAEPLGSSLLAAMAAGLPVVAVASGAMPEVIEPEVSGLLVSHANEQEIAAAVIRILEDSELAALLGARAREVVSEKFTADRMVEETLKVYNQFSSSAENH